MVTTYVLDTSVVLSEGKKAIYSFGENNVVLPITVVKELEKKRNDFDLGYSAREVLREISSLRKQGDINEGVSLGEGYGSIRIELNHINAVELPATIKENANNDTRILAVAAALTAELSGPVVLITKDLTLAIYADLVGVTTDSLITENDTDVDKYIQNIQSFQVTSEEIEELADRKLVHLDIDVPVNTGVILLGPEGQSLLAVSKPRWEFKVIRDLSVGAVQGKSKEQKFAMHHLMDNTVGVVSLSGTAGSGKSFLMLAAAISLVRDKSTAFEKIVIFRPVNPVGGAAQELGFLPGDMNEKLAPHMKPVFDTLGTMFPKAEVDRIKREQLIEFDAISHVRGRTLANCIVICDELQNVEKSVIQTLLSRLGVNSRAFIGWDIAQRDAKYIGKYDGIYSVVKKLYGHKLFAHITLKKSERSPVSQMVSDLLEQ